MSQDEEKVLKDLVTQCLATKGFLGKIQAEIRAGVFVALEEQDVLKDIFINKPLKDFIETTNGSLVISLVREFLEFFNLQFTNMVFDPETNAGIDYKFEGRKKLATDLNLTYEQDLNVPLLGLLLQSFDSQNSNKEKSPIYGNESLNNKLAGNEIPETQEDKYNGITTNDNGRPVISDSNNAEYLISPVNISKSLETDEKKLFDTPREGNLTSLNDLPPLSGLKSQNGTNSTLTVNMKQLNELLHFEPDGGDANYEEDFVSSGSDKKDKTDSTESEIEEELPTNSNNSNAEDLTADLTVSKESGQGDYTEKISNS